jgi:bifunctional DNA-binding transcriptional regulator/antitoxin component of YhaV-PrlF toxin-antitoxin module
MAKVTSKLQVTLPKVLAEQYGIAPGDEIAWESAGDAIRVVPGTVPVRPDRETRLHRFDQATDRQRRRDRGVKATGAPHDRKWSRSELYSRGRAR